MHPSILPRGGRSAVERCTTCCRQFHCPLCPKRIFKPSSPSKLKRHLQVHLKNAIAFEDKIICHCHFNCRNVGHYHCPFCNNTILRRRDMVAHLKSCPIQQTSTSAAAQSNQCQDSSVPSLQPSSSAASISLLPPTIISPSPDLLVQEDTTTSTIPSAQSIQTSTSHTWHFPCELPRMSYVHKNISKWHSFQTNPDVFRTEETSTSTPKQHQDTVYPPSAEVFKQVVAYIYGHKNRPANLPDDVLQPKALTDYVTELQPAETVCALCRGPVILEKSARISRKARIIPMNGVIEMEVCSQDLLRKADESLSVAPQDDTEPSTSHSPPQPNDESSYQEMEEHAKEAPLNTLGDTVISNTSSPELSQQTVSSLDATATVSALSELARETDIVDQPEEETVRTLLAVSGGESSSAVTSQAAEEETVRTILVVGGGESSSAVTSQAAEEETVRTILVVGGGESSSAVTSQAAEEETVRTILVVGGGESSSAVTSQAAEEETDTIFVSQTSSVSGCAVGSQAAGEEPCSDARTLLDTPSPMETQEDALDEMEVNTIKVEDENMACVNDEQEEDGEVELKGHGKIQEEDMKGMPVISSVVKGSVDSLSFCSLDMGVDMTGEMATGTDDIMDQDQELEDGEKKIMVEEDSSDSMPSDVNTVSIREDSHPDPLSCSTSPSKAAPQFDDTDCTGGVKLGLREHIERVKVKDEPVDKEYDEALVSCFITGQVKDEPETAEDNLKISNVFSVGGDTLSSGTMASPAVVPTPNKATVSHAQPLPLHSTRVSCAACKITLLKGQKAYQKKGSPVLFCSPACLTRPLPVPLPPSKLRDETVCHYCSKKITHLKTFIKATVDMAGTRKAFCSNTCLCSSEYKRKTAGLTLSCSTPSLTPAVEKITEKCSFCKIPCITQHEVTVKGVVYKLCGDSCFKSFRVAKLLKLCSNTCTNCGAYCADNSPQMKVDKLIKSFCKAACKATYKQMSKTLAPCTVCHAFKPLSDMVESTDPEGKTELFCNASCLTAHKIVSVSSSGALVECNCCKQKAVPAFHLAMSDSSIRNFCSIPCVLSFQEQFNKSNEQNLVNVVQKSTLPPAAPIQSQTAPTAAQEGVKLACFQCHRLYTNKPEILQNKDKFMFLCSPECSEECKKTNFVMDQCTYCRFEKVVNEVRRINSKDCSFCSEGCKLLHNLDLGKLWGRYCLDCTFCSSTSQKLVTGQFGGTSKDFCSESCRSKYTLLFYQLAKCDSCGCQGNLMEKLHMQGEVKLFCDIQCVLQFCFQKNIHQNQTQNQTRVPVSIAPVGVTTVASRSTPVIANVVSLASAPTKQPITTASVGLQGAIPGSFMKILGNASTQTDMARAPPAAPPRILKNKALLCKPMIQNKGMMCKPQMANAESQTDERSPKVIVLPIPVPVYVPIPMNLYAQYAPKPVGFPIPVPVPVFLPVTLDSAESIVKAILDIKEKIPSNPFEADVLLMAEMVAEDGEEDRPAQAPAAPIQDDRVSNYSEDLDTDDITSFLSSWQEECDPDSSPSSLPFAREMLPSKVAPPAQPPVLDIESDYPIETLELMAQWREQPQQPPSPPAPHSPPRQRPRRKVQKKKKGHETRASAIQEALPAVASLSRVQEELGFNEPPKLQLKYGVDAWKRWVQWRNSRPDVEPAPRFGSRPMVLKDDVLKCSTAELGFGLCRFISEVQRPNGQRYSPDSLFYLCLGLQQYLFENSRMENIFTDLFYSKFTMEIAKLLKDFKPTITRSGYIHSRVEEEYLWECKQLGAYSPIVLLNTLLFFCTKYFHFCTLAQHHQLSFGHVMRCSRASVDGSKINFLRFYPPFIKNQSAEGGTVKRKREEEENMLEIVENSENPLRCPVRLYNFYLSKCSESVKQRTNVFYLQPERSCVPNSPLWFTSTPLEEATMENMLTRILTVREMHLRPEGEDEASSSPALEGDDDSD